MHLLEDAFTDVRPDDQVGKYPPSQAKRGKPLLEPLDAQFQFFFASQFTKRGRVETEGRRADRPLAVLVFLEARDRGLGIAVQQLADTADIEIRSIDKLRIQPDRLVRCPIQARSRQP